MDLRIFTEPQQGATYDQLLRVARAAEALGYGAFFRSDHYLKQSGDGLPGPTDAWITLAGLARDTTTIRLGTLLTAATFRLPGPLAIAVAEVDAMSGGRIELGLGAGWYEAEHTAYGIAFPSVHERFDRLEEQLEIITGLWDTPSGELFSFAGNHYQLSESPALPKPAQRPHPPVIVGGTGLRRTPALAARYADEYNVAFEPIPGTKAAIQRVREACAEAGRGVEPLYSAAQTVCCGVTQTQVQQRATTIRRDLDELRTDGLAGTPDEIVDKIGRLGAVGVRRIYLQVLDLSDLDQLELVAGQVMSQL